MAGRADGLTGEYVQYYATNLIRLGAVALCLVVGACATVKVRKVPTPTQYMVWTDPKQAAADEMEGFRFYLPRPYVSVFESFPIHADVFVVEGTVSPDGKYVILDVPQGSQLSLVVGHANQGMKFATRSIHSSGTERLPRYSAESDTEDLNSLGPTTSTSTTTTTTTSSTTSTTAPPTGQNSRRVTSDSDAFAYVPLRGNFDIVYLPDFDEQYVVSSEANMGNAQFQLNLGQGWSLQGFNSLTDNSEVNRRLFQLIDRGTELGFAALQAATGLPGVQAQSSKLVLPSAGKAMSDGVPGTKVAVKVTIVHYASKGLYPVLKPRELTTGKGATVQDTVIAIELATGTQRGALTPSGRAFNGQPRFSVPVYPYQHISFNTFQVLALEVVAPDAKPFEHLHDKTGTVGVLGQARTGSDSPPSKGTRRPSVQDRNGSGNAALDQLAKLLSGVTVSEPLEMDGGFKATVKKAVVNKTSRKVDAVVEVVPPDPNPDNSQPPSRESIASALLVRAITKNPDLANLGLSAENVSVTYRTDPQSTRRRVLARPIPDRLAESLSPDQARTIQHALCMRGSQQDGMWGPITQRHLRAYQRHVKSKTQDGTLTESQVEDLLDETGRVIAERCQSSDR